MVEGPDNRYGRQHSSRWLRRSIVVVLAALVVATAVTIAIVGYQRLGRHDVEGTMAGYRLIDDETVSVTLTVRRSDPSRPAVCIVRARSKDGSEAGRRELLIAPSDRASVQVTTIVKASRPPVMGDVYGCGLNVPSYLVAS
jgi:hypothetical protein